MSIKEKIDNKKFENELYRNGITLIAGVDEVGRGPLVGPVVACAVILPQNYILEGLTDSKKLSEKKREAFYEIIMEKAISVGVGIVDSKIIDEINILEASKLAMEKAVKNCNIQPQYLLIDGNQRINSNLPMIPIIKGDYLSQSIAAASVVAKVIRDKMMYELDEKYPQYGFKKHKGYPTKEHVESVKKHGILDNYRFTYRPIRDLIDNELKGGINEKNNEREII